MTYYNTPLYVFGYHTIITQKLLKIITGTEDKCLI